MVRHLANAPEASDSSFSIDNFVATINKDLNGVFGNFVQRVMKMTASKLGAVVPQGGELLADDNEFIQTLQTRVDDYFKYS